MIYKTRTDGRELLTSERFPVASLPVAQPLITLAEGRAVPADAASNGDDPWAGWEAWMRGHLDNEREQMHAGVGGALPMLSCELRDEFAAAFAKRDKEIAELRGQVSTLLALLGIKVDVLPLQGRRA